MPISVDWDNDSHNLIIVRYQGAYTWDELDTVTDQLYSMLKSVSHKVNVISVLDPNGKAPKEGNMMSRFGKILRDMPRNVGVYFNVGQGNAFSRSVANIVLKVYPVPFKMISTGTEDEARRILAERQPV